MTGTMENGLPPGLIIPQRMPWTAFPSAATGPVSGPALGTGRGVFVVITPRPSGWSAAPVGGASGWIAVSGPDDLGGGVLLFTMEVSNNLGEARQGAIAVSRQGQEVGRVELDQAPGALVQQRMYQLAGLPLAIELETAAEFLGETIAKLDPPLDAIVGAIVAALIPVAGAAAIGLRALFTEVPHPPPLQARPVPNGEPPLSIQYPPVSAPYLPPLVPNWPAGNDLIINQTLQTLVAFLDALSGE